jgi:hypothetical protein
MRHLLRFTVGDMSLAVLIVTFCLVDIAIAWLLLFK